MAQNNNKKIKLSIYERLELPGILPDKEGIDRAIICNDIREKIQLSQKELKQVELKTERGVNGQIFTTWNPDKDKERIFEFTDLEVDVLRIAFKKLDEAKEIKVDPRFIALYRKFVD